MNANAGLAFIRRHGIVFKCAAERFLQSHGTLTKSARAKINAASI
jgi:hypothetical protein